MDILWRLSEIRTPFLDKLIGIITRFGEETLIIFVVCLTFWCFDKDLAYRIGTTFFLSGVTVQCAKVTFRIDRPWILDSNFQPVEEAIAEATGYSFPSGHTQAATSLYASVAFYFKQTWVRILCIFIFLSVGFSRMYLGVHTPADVIVSLIICFILAAAVNTFFNKYNGKKTDMILSIIIACCAVVCFVYPYMLYQAGTIEITYAADCAKQAGSTLAFAIGFYLERNYIKYDIETTTVKKIIRFVIGIVITLGIRAGLKPVLGSSITADTIRYFITVFWVLAIYPFIIKKLNGKI